MTSLATRLLAGDRLALAKAITLVESTKTDHRVEAEELLHVLLPHAGGATRIGISGPPGVGKSTFIESFGLQLTAAGHRVAVLAVDPSSRRGGGSILGDKTRMEMLSRDERAFIRPSPAGGTLGGVARRTRDTLLLCEAAGFDVVIVETVGVGQSETAVADITDCFVLLVNPGGGDDLQGIKRGIMELADLVVVTKADGDLTGPARIAAADYGSALQLIRPKWAGWQPPVLSTSAVNGIGVAEVWQAIEAFVQARTAAGELATLRSAQAKAALWGEVLDAVTDRVQQHPRRVALEALVESGAMLPSVAARELLSS